MIDSQRQKKISWQNYHGSVFPVFFCGILLLKIILMGLFSSDYQNQMFMRFVDGFLQELYAGNLDRKSVV